MSGLRELGASYSDLVNLGDEIIGWLTAQIIAPWRPVKTAAFFRSPEGRLDRALVRWGCEHGDPRLWWTFDADRKACVVAVLASDGIDHLDKMKQNKQKKPGHETPQWMQAGSTNFMPDLD